MASILAACGGQSSGNSSTGASVESTVSESEASGSTDASAESPVSESEALDVADEPDYSEKDAWYQIPEITKEVDTFFIYPTEYLASSQ